MVLNSSFHKQFDGKETFWSLIFSFFLLKLVVSIFFMVFTNGLLVFVGVQAEKKNINFLQE